MDPLPDRRDGDRPALGAREARLHSVPLLVRPGPVIPVGAVDDRPDYDYADGVTLHAYGLERGAQVTVPVGDVTFTVVREGDTLRASCERPVGALGAGGRRPEVRAKAGTGFLTMELGGESGLSGNDGSGC